MKIAILGAIDSPVIKDATGGTEIWTYNFSEELMKRGHDVTVFANSESVLSSKLVKTTDYNDLIDEKTKQIIKARFAFFCIDEMVELVKRQDEFDLIHVSVYSLLYVLPLANLIKKPVVVTIHGSGLTYDDAKIVIEKCPNVHFVFISKSFAKTWPEPKKSRIIYNGINVKDFPLSDKPREYYFWMSRISKEKGVEDVIKFAKKSGEKVVIAGPVRDEEYFNNQVKPNLGKNISYVGELGLMDKVKYYQGAKAFLFPIKWPEPFGLVVVEAMSCGTPVVAYNLGAMNELIERGKTGFLARPNNIDDLIKYSKLCEGIKPTDCRESVKKLFSIEHMVDQYMQYYDQIIRDYTKP